MELFAIEFFAIELFAMWLFAMELFATHPPSVWSSREDVERE